MIRLLYFGLYSVNNIFMDYLTIQTRSAVLKKHILTTFNKLVYQKLNSVKIPKRYTVGYVLEHFRKTHRMYGYFNNLK